MCVWGVGLRRILHFFLGLRIDEKVGNHCSIATYLCIPISPTSIVWFFNTRLQCARIKLFTAETGRPRMNAYGTSFFTFSIFFISCNSVLYPLYVRMYMPHTLNVPRLGSCAYILDFTWFVILRPSNI